MKRPTEAPDVEPHVFDQTNGLVDRGADRRDAADPDRDELRNRTLHGMAMLSANRPAG